MYQDQNNVTIVGGQLSAVRIHLPQLQLPEWHTFPRHINHKQKNYRWGSVLRLYPSTKPHGRAWGNKHQHKTTEVEWHWSKQVDTLLINNEQWFSTSMLGNVEKQWRWNLSVAAKKYIIFFAEEGLPLAIGVLMNMATHGNTAVVRSVDMCAWQFTVRGLEPNIYPGLNWDVPNYPFLHGFLI